MYDPVYTPDLALPGHLGHLVFGDVRWAELCPTGMETHSSDHDDPITVFYRKTGMSYIIYLVCGLQSSMPSQGGWMSRLAFPLIITTHFNQHQKHVLGHERMRTLLRATNPSGPSWSLPRK